MLTSDWCQNENYVKRIYSDPITFTIYILQHAVLSKTSYLYPFAFS